MMRRKLGILILAGVTLLAGTQEAMRQFEGLRSSLNELTRASLWSGLIVYAQPVSDGQLPAPQIYYLMPQAQTSPAAPQEAVIADNSGNNSEAAKPEARNNHVAEEVAAVAVAAPETEALPHAPHALEVEDAAKSELALNEVAAPLVVRHPVAAPKLEKVRVYEEVARNESGARKFKLKQNADVIARRFVKEFDAAKLEAELARLAAVQEELETSKLKASAEAENFARRFDLKVLRRGLPHERPARIRVVAPRAGRHAIALPEISTIGCEKAKQAPAAVAAKTIAAAGMAAGVKIVSEPPIAVEAAAPALSPAPLATSTSWALGCDTEPEHK